MTILLVDALDDRVAERIRYNPAPVLRGLVLIGLAAIFWGTTGSVSTILAARADAEPLFVGAARTAVAALMLLVATRLIRTRPTLGPGEWRRCLAMGVCMAVYQAAYFSAVAMTGIALAALIAICSAPLMIAALAILALGERLTARVAAALALGVTGTTLLVAAPLTATPAAARFVAGAALAFVAGVAYAVYAVIAKAAAARAHPLALTAATFTTAAVLMLPLLAVTRAPLLQAARGWPGLLYLGAVATAGAYVLYTLGLRRVPASVAGIVTLLEPLTATLLAVGLFGERLGGAGTVGAALLLAAITLLLRGPAVTTSPPAATPPG